MTKLGNSDLVDLTLECTGETPKAFKIHHWTERGGDVDIWLPKSLVEREGSLFTMPEWLAIEKGLA